MKSSKTSGRASKRHSKIRGITKRKRIEDEPKKHDKNLARLLNKRIAELERTETRFQRYIKEANDLIFTLDVSGKITSANPATSRATGYSVDELLGKDPLDFVVPEARASVRAALRKVRRGEHVQRVEAEIISKDGRRISLEVRGRLIHEGKRRVGTFYVARDITNRKQTEEAMLRQADLLQKTFDSMTDAVFILDAPSPPSAPSILECNEAASSVFGYEKAEMLGKSTDFLHVSMETLKEFQSQLYPAVAESRLPFHLSKFRMRRKGGSVFPSEHVVTQLLNEKGDRTGWISIVRDITERRRMEEEIESLARFPSENPNPVLRLDRHGTVLSANEASKALFQDWGSGIGQVAPESWRDLVTDALSTGQSRNVDIESGGKSYTFLVRPVIEAGYVNLYGRDITERKQAEEALRRRAEELDALQATVIDITREQDLRRLLQTIVERATRLLNAHGGNIFLSDPERREVRCLVSYNLPTDVAGSVLKYGEGAGGIVAETGKPLIIDDYRTWEGRAAVYEKEQRFTVFLSSPMFWQGKVTGVINIVDDLETRRFTQADQELLTLFANHAAIAVENTRLLGQEKRHAEELTRYSTSLEQQVLERTQKLAASERRFREIADLLPELVYETDLNRDFIFINRAGLEATGYTDDDIRRGLNAFQLVMPKDRNRAVENIQRVLAGERPQPREYQVRRKDGTAFPAIVHSAPIVREGKPVGLRGIVVDITERKRAEEELRAARERLEYVITSNPAVIYSGRPLADYSDFVLTYLSERVVSMLGFEPRDFVGHPEFWERHVPPEDVRSVQAEMPRLWKEAQHTFEYRFMHKDGTYRWIREEASVVRDADGKPAEINGYWTDVTERKRLEEALLKSQRMATIGELAAMVGHDLRNPLTGIVGAAYYLKVKLGSKIGGREKEMLDLIQQGVEHSNEIINDLLDYSRELRLELTDASVRSITKEALAQVKIPAQISVVDSSRDEPRIVLDAQKIRRVFVNLIENAVDAMSRGGTLTIASTPSNGKMQISFTDTGVGIPTETMQKIGTPLFTTKAKGIGLGLPICKRIVEAHGGTITLESEAGKGTTVTITLPLKQT